MRISGVVGGARNDFVFAFRQLARNRGFTAVVVLTLDLAIGANSAIFSVVDGVLLHPLPYPDAERLLLAWEGDRFSGTTREDASVPDYYDLREQNQNDVHVEAGLGARTLRVLFATRHADACRHARWISLPWCRVPRTFLACDVQERRHADRLRPTGPRPLMPHPSSSTFATSVTSLSSRRSEAQRSECRDLLCIHRSLLR